MNEFMQWYWSWGVFVSMILVFLGGVFIGWMLHKERVEKLLYEENLRIATTNSIKLVFLEDAWEEG